MRNISIYNEFIKFLPEGKKLPSSLDGDLRKMSESLENVSDMQQAEEIIQKYSLLRSRIVSAAGVSAAQAFDQSVNELMKKL
jgi:hypothetical protein